jgi:hypothetical protein
MRVTQFVGRALFAIVLCMLVVKVQAVPGKGETGQIPRGLNEGVVWNIDSVDGPSFAGGDTPGLTSQAWQQREPNCCGQCTTTDNKQGCTITRSDGSKFCSGC